MNRLLFIFLALAGCHATTTATAPELARPVMPMTPPPRPGLDCAEVRAQAERLQPKELSTLFQALELPDFTDQAESLPALGPCTRLAEDAQGDAVDAWATRTLGEDALVSTSLAGCVDREGTIVEVQATRDDVTASFIGRLVGARLEPVATSTFRASGSSVVLSVRGLGDLDGDGTRDLLYAEDFVADDGERLRLWAVLSTGRKLEVGANLWAGDYGHLVQRGERVLVVTASRELEQGDGASLQAWAVRFGVLERDAEVEAELQQRLAPVLKRLRALARLRARQREHVLEPGEAEVLGPLTPAMEGCLSP